MKIRSVMLTLKVSDGPKLEYSRPVKVELEVPHLELLLAEIVPSWLKTIESGLELIRAEIEKRREERGGGPS